MSLIAQKKKSINGSLEVNPVIKLHLFELMI